jgi:hypothetical protein
VRRLPFRHAPEPNERQLLAMAAAMADTYLETVIRIGTHLDAPELINARAALVLWRSWTADVQRWSQEGR